MLPQLWLKRRVRVKWIAHSALPPLRHLCFFGPDKFLLKAACTGPSANPKQEQRQGKCTTSRMCDLFCSDPAFYPRLRQHCRTWRLAMKPNNTLFMPPSPSQCKLSITALPPLFVRPVLRHFISATCSTNSTPPLPLHARRGEIPHSRF